jgi:hypothetical protein
MKKIGKREFNDTISKFSSNTLNVNLLRLKSPKGSNLTPLNVLDNSKSILNTDDDHNESSFFLDLDFEEIQDRIEEINETPV